MDGDIKLISQENIEFGKRKQKQMTFLFHGKKLTGSAVFLNSGQTGQDRSVTVHAL